MQHAVVVALDAFPSDIYLPIAAPQHPNRLSQAVLVYPSSNAGNKQTDSHEAGREAIAGAEPIPRGGRSRLEDKSARLCSAPTAGSGRRLCSTVPACPELEWMVSLGEVSRLCHVPGTIWGIIVVFG